MSVTLQVAAGADAEAEEIDIATRGLRQHLLETDVRSVERLRGGEAPIGARAADPLVLGGLVVTLARSPEVVKMLAAAIQSWVAGRTGRSVELQLAGDTLKVTGISSDEQLRLIELFVQRHASG